MVAVRLSQQEPLYHCHGTREIDDGRHVCGLLVRAWYQVLCQNAAANVVARQRPVGNGAMCNLYCTCYFTPMWATSPASSTACRDSRPARRSPIAAASRRRD
jgi:hypothetical protein